MAKTPKKPTGKGRKIFSVPGKRAKPKQKPVDITIPKTMPELRDCLAYLEGRAAKAERLLTRLGVSDPKTMGPPDCFQRRKREQSLRVRESRVMSELARINPELAMVRDALKGMERKCNP
ncbi:MAG: hypothetical protein JXB14_06945 [Candidatus Altiarchaeota archaeon]|nr:hypothetical protein [Candidatus Altiarchaeota archaeon]